MACCAAFISRKSQQAPHQPGGVGSPGACPFFQFDVPDFGLIRPLMSIVAWFLCAGRPQPTSWSSPPCSCASSYLRPLADSRAKGRKQAAPPTGVHMHIQMRTCTCADAHAHMHMAHAHMHMHMHMRTCTCTCAHAHAHACLSGACVNAAPQPAPTTFLLPHWNGNGG